MKKSFALATVAFVLGCAVALIARFAGFSFSNVLSPQAVIGGVFAGSLLLFAFSDYTRKPRFRAGGARQAKPQTATPTMSPELDPASAWTYTTISA